MLLTLDESMSVWKGKGFVLVCRFLSGLHVYFSFSRALVFAFKKMNVLNLLNLTW